MINPTLADIGKTVYAPTVMFKRESGEPVSVWIPMRIVRLDEIAPLSGILGGFHCDIAKCEWTLPEGAVLAE